MFYINFKPKLFFLKSDLLDFINKIELIKLLYHL